MLNINDLEMNEAIDLEREAMQGVSGGQFYGSVSQNGGSSGDDSGHDIYYYAWRLFYY
jgi:hypothetical protein